MSSLTEKRLREIPVEEMRAELYSLGYRATAENDFWGSDQMDADELFDRLLEYYTLYPEKDPALIFD